MKLEPIVQLGAGWTAVAGRFGVHLFEGHLSLADMDQMLKRGDAWFSKNPGRLVELTIVHPSDAKMTTQERARMADLIRRWEKHRVAAATVILAEGLLGAFQRSVLTGMLMLAPPPHPAKIFSSTPEGIGWLAPHVRSLCGPEATPAAIARAVSDLSAAFLKRPTALSMQPPL